MPVDVIKEQRARPPQTNDAVPLLSKMRYDRRIHNVMSRVFGKTLVCRDWSHMPSSLSLLPLSPSFCASLSGGFD